MVEKPMKLQPVLIGGLVLGLGSLIPVVSYGNLCCCGWGIAGGALAAYLLVKRSPVLPISTGDGASAGALAGVVGSLIYLIIGVPISLLRWDALIAQMDQRANLADAASRELMIQIVATMQNYPVLIALAFWLLFAIVCICAAAVGGLIGVSIFEKRKGQYPPQQPPPGPGFPPGYAPPNPPPGGPQRPDAAPYGASDPPEY